MAVDDKIKHNIALSDVIAPVRVGYNMLEIVLGKFETAFGKMRLVSDN